MVCSPRILLKKTFSLSLILNSMITIASVLGILYGFYLSYWKSITFSLPYYWKPYSPYLINANLFLIVGIAALINIFPSAAIGRCLHTGRFLFHHYVYGFFVLITSSVYIIGFTSVSLLNLFFVNSTNIAVNTGRFFILTGLTLFIDDLPDVSRRVESALNKLKSKIYQIRKIVHVTQIVTGIITFYVFLSMALSIQQHSNLTVANVLTMSTILITSFTSFASAKRKDWLKITIEK